MTSSGPRLLAVSDLHVGHRGNDGWADHLHPDHPGDWLIIAGDVAERVDDVARALATLAGRYDRVLWVPGNHELWSGRDDSDPAPARYARLVALCRDLGVDTPEDLFPLWTGPGGPAWVVPMFLLYDHSWTRVPGDTPQRARERARAARVVASDEYLIDASPHADVATWCRERLVTTTRRLAELDAAHPTVLVNHWPLVREPTRVLTHPDFALWCGTEQTADWHRRYRAVACIYGHLHIPRSHEVDGVRFEECSLGYPREWRRRGHPVPLARTILPAPTTPQVRWVRTDDGGLHVDGPGVQGSPVDERDPTLLDTAAPDPTPPDPGPTDPTARDGGGRS